MLRASRINGSRAASGHGKAEADSPSPLSTRASVRVVSRPEEVSSVRQAAAACNVTPPVVRRWLSLGLIPGPPWTLQQLHQIRDETDPEGRRRGPQVPHGTLTRWLEGCDCDRCREAQNDAARARFRRKAQQRLPTAVRQQLLDGIYRGEPFRAVLHELGLTSNQVWGLTKNPCEEGEVDRP